MKIEEAQAKITELEAQVTELSARKPDPTQYVELSVLVGVQTELKAAEDQLAAIQTAQAEAELSATLEAAVAEGRILPTQVESLREFGKANFAALQAFIANAQPIAALKGTQTGGRAPGETKAATFKAPHGFEVDQNAQALHAQALAHQQQHGGDYLSAVMAVSH